MYAQNRDTIFAEVKFRMVNDMERTTERLDARACASSYAILGSIFGFIFITSIILATGSGGDWKLVLLTGTVFVVTMLWVATIRIQYSDGVLSYYTLFSGKRTVPLSDIESAETKVISTGKGSTIVLLVHLQGAKVEKPMAIKIKLFSKEDVRQLFDVLGPKFKGPRRIGVYTDETA